MFIPAVEAILKQCTMIFWPRLVGWSQSIGNEIKLGIASIVQRFGWWFRYEAHSSCQEVVLSYSEQLLPQPKGTRLGNYRHLIGRFLLQTTFNLCLFDHFPRHSEIINGRRGQLAFLRVNRGKIERYRFQFTLARGRKMLVESFPLVVCWLVYGRSLSVIVEKACRT